MPSKSLRTLFIESVLFIGLFALVAHLSVNFWERYVIQNELSKMKSSLHNLKDTIINIGIAYDHLQNNLKTFTVASQHPKDHEYRKTQTVFDAYVQPSFVRDDMKKKASMRNKNEQKSFHDEVVYRPLKNATTFITPLTRNIQIQKFSPDDTDLSSARFRNSMTNRSMEFSPLLANKHIQNSRKSVSQPVDKKDATTRTRNPLKSTGADTRLDQETCVHRTKSKSGRAGWFNKSSPKPSCVSRYHSKCIPSYYQMNRF